MNHWINWVSYFLAIAAPIAVWASQHWIKARVERSVRHTFDEKLEALRAELRRNEEALKSDLRVKETEISSLRDGVLSGRANRQALLDKRRIEAAERLWAAVTALAPYKSVSASLAVFNVEAVARRAPSEPNLRKMFEIIGKNVPETNALGDAGQSEKLFVSSLAWAYFSAYQSIVGSAFGLAKMFELGIDEPEKMINREYIRNLLKATLPHHTDFIDNSDVNSYYYLLEELEEKLLTELQKIIEGAETDQRSLAQSADIVANVKRIMSESEEKAVRADSSQINEVG